MDANRMFRPNRPPRRDHEEQAPTEPPANALVPQADGGMVYKRFVMHPTALSIPEDTTEAEWMEFGFLVKHLDSTLSWVIGEWAEFANKNWHIAYETIAEHFGYEVSTLMSYASIVRNVPALIRNQGLSFAHHRLVATLTEDQQEMWLERAVNKGWSAAQMKTAMHPKREQDASVMNARKLRKRVRDFTSELDDLASKISEEDRREIALFLAKFAKKYGR